MMENAINYHRKRIMKFIPMSFSTPMVQANLAGRKNQTRRLKGLELFNAEPDKWRYDGIKEEDPSIHYFEQLDKNGIATERYQPKQCPYGQPGDVLWMREACCTAPDGFAYKADHIELSGFRPSIHMPIEACRSWCIVEAIEAQRLQDITEADAIGEGIEIVDKHFGFYKLYPSHQLVDENNSLTTRSPEYSYYSLWISINGCENWELNPWVWVVRYRFTTTPPDGWEGYVGDVTAMREYRIAKLKEK